MRLLVKNLRKFLFCEDLALNMELKKVLDSEDLHIEILSYYEILHEILRKRHFTRKISLKTLKADENELKINKKLDFEAFLKEVNEENRNLKLENDKLSSFLKDLKPEIESLSKLMKSEDFLKEKEENCEIFLKENINLKLVLVRLKEVFSYYMISFKKIRIFIRNSSRKNRKTSVSRRKSRNIRSF